MGDVYTLVTSLCNRCNIQTARAIYYIHRLHCIYSTISYGSYTCNFSYKVCLTKTFIYTHLQDMERISKPDHHSESAVESITKHGRSIKGCLVTGKFKERVPHFGVLSNIWGGEGLQRVSLPLEDPTCPCITQIVQYNRNGVMLHVPCGGAVGKLNTGFYHRLQSITGDSMISLLLGTILTKRVCPKWSTPLRLRPLGDTVLFSQAGS